METRVKWMPYSTKERIHVRAFSRNQVYIWKYENHRENQRNQNNQRGQGKNYQQPSRKPQIKKQTNVQTHVGQSEHGSETFLFFLFVGFSRWLLTVVALASLVVLVSLVLPMVVDVLKLLHCMFKRVPGNN